MLRNVLTSHPILNGYLPQQLLYYRWQEAPASLRQAASLPLLDDLLKVYYGLAECYEAHPVRFMGLLS